MPAPFFKASHWLPTIRIAPGLWAVLFMFTQTAAADVLVVTDSRHPVQAPAGVQFISAQSAGFMDQVRTRLDAVWRDDLRESAAAVPAR